SGPCRQGALHRLLKLLGLSVGASAGAQRRAWMGAVRLCAAALQLLVSRDRAGAFTTVRRGGNRRDSVQSNRGRIAYRKVRPLETGTGRDEIRIHRANWRTVSESVLARASLQRRRRAAADRIARGDSVGDACGRVGARESDDNESDYWSEQTRTT